MERAGEKLIDQQIKIMKKILLIVLLFAGIKSYSQTVTYYNDSLVYSIDTTIIAGDDTIISGYVQHNYHYINPDSIYEDQFVIIDSLGNLFVPIQALIDKGYSSSGTVKRLKLDSTQILWTPLQLRDSLIFPDLQLIYGNLNVTKL